MGPQRLSCISPNNFIAGDIGLLIVVPLDRRIVGQARRKGDSLWSRGRRSQDSQRSGIHARNVCDVVKVIELWQVAVLNAILLAHVLMLMLVILVRLSEAHCRIAAFEEGLMIATAAIPIPAIDHPDFHRRHVALAGLLNKASQLARRRIILTAHAAAG